MAEGKKVGNKEERRTKRRKECGGEGKVKTGFHVLCKLVGTL